jgi:hypothetical protein
LAVPWRPQENFGNLSPRGRLRYADRLRRPRWRQRKLSTNIQPGPLNEGRSVARPSRLCQLCATPSSNSSLDYRRDDARIAENGFATSSGVNKSAKIVLAKLVVLSPNDLFNDRLCVLVPIPCPALLADPDGDFARQKT